MSERLYLDTARLGRMSPGAQQAQRDFAALAGEEGGSPAFERLLRGDPEASGLGRRYPGLSTWRGIDGLKQSLRALAGSTPDLPVLLANRSAQLMKLAARLLFHPCRNVLVTDLGWPGYHDILAEEARRAGRAVTTVPVRDAVLHGHATADAVVEQVCAAFGRRGCDGLFLSAVSNLGVRLPVERIVRRLEARHEVWFAVVDGAQDFCHLASDLSREFCDLYLAGAHKWLGAYCPMGLGFYGRRRSKGVVETILAHMLAAGDLDDPLLRFTLDGAKERAGVTETVNVAPLFACQGAAADAGPSDAEVRLANAEEAARVAQVSGWRPLLAAPALRTGILLLQAERPHARQAEPAALRAAFHDRGAVLTAYDGGQVRLSMPGRPWQSGELDVLARALRSNA